ncbi:MAG: FAD:protein FMN transferase [Chitinispirillaceae bacterium]|nr:FAD:protein FMN transferase [Chitinispirillaceae bacterium]
MDTVIEVTIAGEKREEDRCALLWRQLDSLFSSWEIRFSQTTPASEVLRINNRRSKALPLSSDLAFMVERALRFGDTLDGDFDLSIFPVKELWGFGEQDTALHIPSRHELDSVLRCVSYTKIGLTATRDTIIIHDPRIAVDVGGVAKGAALRASARLLQRQGMADFLIAAGGDIVSSGKKPDGTAWYIGIQHPRKQGALLAALALDSGSVVTSGDYERYYMEGGTRYHHLFDPHTGRPCGRNQSLTIWSMDPVEADILSTGLFARPADSILCFVNARPRLECVVVDSLGRAFVSSGWKNRIIWK